MLDLTGLLQEIGWYFHRTLTAPGFVEWIC
jgi:hypothetical protein